MYISGDKIRQLIERYGNNNGYPKKSHLMKFCEDNKVNYSQWNAYIGERQKPGIRIVELLMEVFPNLNMNWFFKEDQNMFIVPPSKEYPKQKK